MSDSSEIRLSDAERESALSALGTHMGTGRIDVDEFSERSGQVAAAKTRGDLVRLFADLPQPHPDFESDSPAPRPQPAPEAGPEPHPVVRHGETGKRLAVGVGVAVAGVALVVFVLTHLWLLLVIPAGIAIVGAIVWAASHVRGSWFADSEFDAEFDAQFDKQFNQHYSMHDPGYSKNYTKHYLRNYMRKYGERYDPRRDHRNDR